MKDLDRPEWTKNHPAEWIFKDSRQIGQIWFRPIDVLTVEIDHFEVAPKFRGQGLAKVLLNEFLNSAEFKDKTVWLEVSSKNLKAIKVYLNCGFKQVSVRANYYQDGSDALLLSYS